MAQCPYPADFGRVLVWEAGAEGPRPRRPDEATVDGEEDDHPDRFIIGPAIGVRSLAHHVPCALRAMHDRARRVLARVPQVAIRAGESLRTLSDSSFKKSNVWWGVSASPAHILYSAVTT